MSSSSQLIATNLASQLDAIERLGGILQAERAALDADEPEPLEQVSISKEQALQELSRLGTELDRLSGGRDRLHSDRLVEPTWSRLLAMAAELQQLNASNGALLNARRLQVRAALRACGSDASATYGRTGFDPDLPASRRIASA